MGLCANSSALEGFDGSINASLAVSLVISLIGNGFVCFIVARHYQLRTVTNACIVNMAVAQFFLSLICAPSLMEILRSLPYHISSGFTLCLFHRVCFVFFATVICFAFLLMAAERYVVVSTAGRSKLTNGKTTKLILFSWCLAGIYAIPWAIITENDRIICTGASNTLPPYLTCMPLLLSPQTKSSRVLNRCSLFLYFILPMTLMAGLFLLQCKPLWRGFSAVRPLGAGHPRSIRYSAEIKTTRTMVVVATLFLAAWTPYCVISLTNAFHETTSFNGSAYTAVVCLVHLSTCFNPLVFALRNPRFSIVMRGARRRSPKIQVQLPLQGRDQHRITTLKAQSMMLETSRSDETQTTGLSERN